MSIPMAISKRNASGKISSANNGGMVEPNDDNKLVPKNGFSFQQQRRRCSYIIVSAFLIALYCYQYSISVEENNGSADTSVRVSSSSSFSSPNTVTTTVTAGETLETVANALYPFLSSNGNEKVPFPIIPTLGNCTLSFQPPQQPRTDASQWRKPFWIPSFPSSGASNPTNKGDLSREIIAKLTGLADKPVKNYHMSMRKRLKRCHGISETVACTQGHPIVPIQPETQTQNFQPKAIVFVRNFVTAFPASLTDKNIAYHNADQQNTVSEYKRLRDEWVQPTFDSWTNLLEWWRTSDDYDVALYVPYEELMTTHREKARAVLQQLSAVLKEGGFEVASSSDDLDCIWYTTIRQEWTRQQTIMNYLPMFTIAQKEWLVSQMRRFIQQVSGSKNGRKHSDASLLAILKQFLNQIEMHLPIQQQ
ncbi:hypothetical protein IV203_003890 [Nitzschia inconspicua]|uniref:Uncharacterized protein n=1 Tax=Nitzschia inconspicua TaxID=303405 RepID=A0A9K3L3E6_9STRA|nr:hypothetical protein IV203_003890 [Nitzschia inconspicua]